MESNKDEAKRCLDIAKSLFSTGDLPKSKRLAEKSKRLYPTNEVEQFLLSINNAKSFVSSCQQKSKVENPRRSPESTNSERKYSVNQISAVKAVLACGGDYYKILSVEKTATDKEVKKAYRTKALLFHPDKNSAPGADEAFKLIAKAYDTLSDYNKRAVYDSGGNTTSRDMRAPSFQHHTKYSYNRRYRQEVSPEDVFNMFFNGGSVPSSFGTPFYNNQPRHRSTGHHRYQQQQQYAHNQKQKQSRFEKEKKDGLYGYLPLFIILAILVLTSLFSPQNDPLYTFQPAASNTYKRTTGQNYVDYYVNPNTFIGKVGNSRYRLKRTEQQIEIDWVNELRKSCNKERKQRGYRSSKKTTTCDTYNRLSRRV
ncbi:hypothetical protein BY458DRAFT_471340 [Sporodiniella umbellata]|nr:hypothetical protein BY458DRAFT_471340 [Sporodiniella umbellata]